MGAVGTWYCFPGSWGVAAKRVLTCSCCSERVPSSLLWAVLPPLPKCPSPRLPPPCPTSGADPAPALFRHRHPKLSPPLPQPGLCHPRFLRLGAPRSTEEAPPRKCSQKYEVLANSLVANEAKGQPLPKKGLCRKAGSEVSLLCLFPFLRTTT